MTTTMIERTDGRDVPASHNLGRCQTCNLAFHYPRADAVTCPKCGAGMFVTTRRLREGFLPLTKEDVKRIQAANGYTLIAQELRVLRRRKADYNRRSVALYDARLELEWIKFTDSKGQEANWAYTHPEAPLTDAERESRRVQIEALGAQRSALYESEGRELDRVERLLWREIKGVPVEVSCFAPAPVAPVVEPAPEPAPLDVDDDLTLSYGGTEAPAAKPAKGTHGGARKGAGRKPVGVDVKVTSISLPADMLATIKAYGGGNLSAGVRRMCERVMAELAQETSEGAA